MPLRRADAAIAVLIFVVAAVLGGKHYSRDVRSGGRPFFYQTYFEPAVMVACGKGFLVAHPQPPVVREFLFQRSDRLSCADLPRDLQVGTEGLYQRPWRYLLTTIGIAWRVLGISWSGLAPLFGILYGATTTLAYLLCRLIAGPIASVACAAAMCLSPIQLSNLLNLRDYAKAPFTIALLLILVALAVRPWRTRTIVGLSLCYGLVMGAGYGFRTDLLVDIPPFLITVLVFLPGGVLRHPGAKAAAVAAFAGGFAAAGWPIITAVASGGGCQWHFLLLGFSSPFNEALGVAGGSYGWGDLYKDEYVWATIASYAGRLRPDLGYIEYCSHEYDVASWDYLRRILTIFPADMLTRAYASAMHVLDLPFQRLAPIRPAGLVMAGAFVMVASWTSIRLALFTAFAILYFGGHPAIQFLPRHYFPFELIAWVMLAFLAEQFTRLAIDLVRSDELEPAVWKNRLRLGLGCALLLTAIFLAPLNALRWYQHARVSRLLNEYAAAPAAEIALKAVAPGVVRIPAAHEGRPLSESEAVAALGRATARLIEVDVAARDCRTGTTVTFRYDSTYPATDFSHAVALQDYRDSGQSTRLFEPVYQGFRGIEVSDPSPACALRVRDVELLDRLPLLLPAQLAPGWPSQPQYKHTVVFR